MGEFINDAQPFTPAMARDIGWTRRDIDRAVLEGHLRRTARGVYVDAHVPDSRRLRAQTIRLVVPDQAVACNETAAWLHGVDAFRPSERFLLEPSFVVPHGSSRVRAPHIRCRQAHIDSEDVTYVGGVHVTTPVRTASDLLRRLYRPYALAAADGFAHASLVDVEELQDFVARLKGYPGIVQARSLSHLVEPLAQSAGESWQRLRILDAGFPRPEAQHEVTDHLGRTFFLDHAYPEVLVGVEYDGREFHTDDNDVAHDVERRDELSALYGWRWSVARREDIFGASTQFEERLGELLGIRPILPRRWGYGR
jgi:hypothetical protein